MNDEMNVTEAAAAGLVANPETGEKMGVVGRYRMECLDADGNVKWVQEFDNMVTNLGKTDMLDKYLGAGTPPAAWYIGLVNNAGLTAFAPADVVTSHAGWTEYTNYSQASRPAATFGSATASGGSSGNPGTAGTATKATSSASAFSINGAGGTVAGCFLISDNTKGGTTTGTLFSAGVFTGGNRTVVSGDTLNVSYSASV